MGGPGRVTMPPGIVVVTVSNGTSDTEIEVMVCVTLIGGPERVVVVPGAVLVTVWRPTMEIEIEVIV